MRWNWPSRSWLWLLLAVPLAAGIGRLRFDAEILNLLPEKLSVAQGLKQYQREFASTRELIVTLEAPTAGEAESGARALAQALRAESNLVEDVIWQPLWMEDPAQAMELTAYFWLNQAPAVFGQLAARLAETNLANTLNETRDRLATSFSPEDLAFGGYDPYGLTRLPESVARAGSGMGRGEEMFVSPDGTFRVIFVEAGRDLAGYQACRSWLAEVQRVIADARSSGKISPNTDVHYTGRPVFVTEISRGMQRDMGGCSGGTLAVIGLLFWLTHRRLAPLVWLLALLVGTLAATLALGGLFVGTINIVSMGFASILLGLAEDFGIVVYEESRSHGGADGRELRRAASPGIWWSAVTTAGAFLILNLSSLPGLGQLGTLIAIGILLAAFVMLHAYAPLVLRLRRPGDDAPAGTGRDRFLLFQTSKLAPARVVWIVTACLLAAAGGLLLARGIRVDNSSDPLKPKDSEAYATLDRIKAHLAKTQDPLWVLVPGRNESEVARRLAALEAALSQAASKGQIAGFTLPTTVWPQPENQNANRPGVEGLLGEREALRRAAAEAGFAPDAFALTENILDVWQRAAAGSGVFWPTNRTSRWLFDKFVARTGGGFLAVGMIQPAADVAVTRKFAADWPREFEREGMILSGWGLVGWTVFDRVLRELPRVLIPVFLLVVFSLWMAFRSAREVLLSLATLAFSALCLAALMAALKWDWNLLNVMSLPLLLGMGVDFSIHIQLALRRCGGDLLAVRRSVGRALLLAGSTTVAGFGSLAFSSNAGMASLGMVCAVGIAVALLVAVYLLPEWWKVFAGVRGGVAVSECR